MSVSLKQISILEQENSKKNGLKHDINILVSSQTHTYEQNKTQKVLHNASKINQTDMHIHHPCISIHIQK